MGVEINIEFERECYTCYTCYGRAAWSKSEDCKTCRGVGRVPTDLGRKLLEFLEHQEIRPVRGKGEGDE